MAQSSILHKVKYSSLESGIIYIFEIRAIKFSNSASLVVETHSNSVLLALWLGDLHAVGMLVLTIIMMMMMMIMIMMMVVVVVEVAVMTTTIAVMITLQFFLLGKINVQIFT